MYYVLMFLWIITTMFCIISFIVGLKRKSRTNKIVSFVTLGLSLLLFISGMVVNANETVRASENQEAKNDIGHDSQTKTTDLIVDANEFSRISQDELISILGEPVSVEDWKLNQKFDAKTLAFADGEMEFILIEGKVVRFNYFKPTDYQGIDDLLSRFSISPSKNLKSISNTQLAENYQMVSDKVGGVYISKIDGKTDEVKITYDLRYFE